MVEARIPITHIKMSRQELIAQLDNYPMPRKEMNAFLKERESHVKKHKFLEQRDKEIINS